MKPVDKWESPQTVILKEYYPIGGCGNIAFAAAYTFILEKDNSVFSGIVECPDTYGDNFFIMGDKYAVKLCDKNIQDSLKGYAIMPINFNLKQDRPPVFLVTDISKAPIR